MSILPVVRPSLVDSVAERIRAYIEEHALKSGDQLPTEPEMAANLGVSRTVLREAVGRLQTIGLLTIQRGRGTFVGDAQSLSNCAKLLRSALTVSTRDWLKLAEFRAAIETHSARLAAQRATDQDFRELEEILVEMDNPSRSYMDSVLIDFTFHHKIVQMSGNELMANTFEVIREFVVAGMVQTTQSPRDHAASQRLHREIFNALRSGDPDKAEREVRAHMDLITVAFELSAAMKEGMS